MTGGKRLFHKALEIQNAQDGAQYRMRAAPRPRSPFALISSSRSPTESERPCFRPDIAPPPPAQHDGLLLVAHVDDALGLDDRLPLPEPRPLDPTGWYHGGSR